MIFLRENLRQWILLTFAGFYLLSFFTGSGLLVNIDTYLLIIILAMSLPGAKPVNKTLVLLLFALSIIILYKSNMPVDRWIYALGANCGLVAIFLALPFLQFPLRYDDYQTSLLSLSERFVRSTTHFGLVAILLNYVLSVFLNVGGISIVNGLLAQNKERYHAESVLCQSLTRGNAAAAIWSPNFVSVAIVLFYTNTRWIDILAWGFVLSLIILLVNWLNLRIRFGSNALPAKIQSPGAAGPAKLNLRKLGKLSVIFLSLIMLVIFFNLVTSWGILIIIQLAAIIYPLFWALAQRKMPEYRQEIKKYYHYSLLNIKNEVLIFAAAGFFGKTLEITGAGQTLSALLHLENVHQPYLAVPALIGLMCLLALVGVHPFVSSTTIATSLTPSALGLSHPAFTFTLLTGFSLAVIFSPFSGTNLIVSGLTNTNPWKTGPRYNLVFVLEIVVIYALVIPFIK